MGTIRSLARKQPSHSGLELVGRRRVPRTPESEGFEASLRDLAEQFDALPAAALPAAVTAVAALLASVASRAIGSQPSARPEAQVADENLSVEEAARRLGISKDYVYRHARRLPFTRRVGRRLLFSSRGLAAWMAQRTGT